MLQSEIEKITALQNQEPEPTVDQVFAEILASFAGPDQARHDRLAVLEGYQTSLATFHSSLPPGPTGDQPRKIIELTRHRIMREWHDLNN